jgi:hypothetical protein
VHEMFTLLEINVVGIQVLGQSSTENSWFPGYVVGPSAKFKNIFAATLGQSFNALVAVRIWAGDLRRASVRCDRKHFGALRAVELYPL